MNISKTTDLLRRDSAVIASGQHLLYVPIAVDTVGRDTVTDVDGNRYIDFLSSASSLNLGGSHPAITQAVMRQLEKCTQYCTCYTLNQPMVEYAERLCSVYPGRIPVKVFFTHSGSDANDLALQCTRAYTGRANIISFEHSYHGSTYASSSLSAGSPSEIGRGCPAIPGIRHFRYFYEGDPVPPDQNYMREIEQAFSTDLAPETVAAVFIEPIQGDGGMRLASREFIHQLYRLCQRHGILFLSDEIQQGFFRSGRWFSIEHYGIVPDGIVLGKSAGAGFPLGALIARPEIIESLSASLCACTMAGFHLACAAGAAQFDYMCQEEFQRILSENSRFLAGRTAMLADHRIPGIQLHATGAGLSYGVHVMDGCKGDPAALTAYKIAFRCYETGLLLLPVAGNVLRIQPPLTISGEHLARGFALLERAIEDVALGYESDEMLRFYPDWYPKSSMV